MSEAGFATDTSTVLFARGGCIYAVAAECVTKVVAMPTVVFPPLLPEGIDGVAAIGGKVVPILALPATGAGRELVLVTCGGDDYGLCADNVLRMTNRSADISMAQPIDIDALVAGLRLGGANAAPREASSAPAFAEIPSDAASAAAPHSAAIAVETRNANYLLPLDCVIELCESLAIVALPDPRPVFIGAGFHRDELLPVLSLAALLDGAAQDEPASAFVVATAGKSRCILAMKSVSGLARDVDPKRVVDLAALLVDVLPEDARAEAPQPPVATETQASKRYLLVEYAAQACAFALEAVARIHARPPLLGVPGMGATSLAGVAAIGGRILPVLDLGKAFGLSETQSGGSLVELKLPQAETFAVAADRILGIVGLTSDALLRPPESSAISALARIDGKTVWILEPSAMAEHAGWGRHAA
ncbi:MAG: chemotaxis protein CheW [Pseudomonadota bacterium]